MAKPIQFAILSPTSIIALYDDGSFAELEIKRVEGKINIEKATEIEVPTVETKP